SQRIDVGIVGNVFGAGAEAIDGDDAQQQPGTHQPGTFAKTAGIIAGLQLVSAEKHDHQRADADQCQPAANGVGLGDVADHFAGINEVVDGDEVEAGTEFIPEGDVGCTGKDHHQ